MYPIRILTTTVVIFFLFSVFTPIYGQNAISGNKPTPDTSAPDVLKNVFYDPGTDVLNVHFRLSGTGDVQFDLINAGTKVSHFSKLISYKETGEMNYIIDMRALPKGSYILDFRSRQRFSGKRLIVKN